MTTPLTTEERWAINDIVVHGPEARAWRLGQGAGLAMTPDVRDEAVAVPQRHGEIEAAAVTYGAGQLIMTLGVLGVDPVTGTVPAAESDSLQLWDDHVGALTALVHTPRLVVRRYRPDGQVREAVGRLRQALDPERQRTHPVYGDLQVAIRIHRAFWRDLDPVTATATIPASGDVVPLYPFGGASAPMDDLMWTIGPAWNPTITDVGSGSWLAYDGVINAGQALVYDGATRSVSGGGDLIVDQGLIRRGRLLSLSPGDPPRIVVESTGPDPVSVQVSGRRAYLTA